MKGKDVNQLLATYVSTYTNAPEALEEIKSYEPETPVNRRKQLSRIQKEKRNKKNKQAKKSRMQNQITNRP